MKKLLSLLLAVSLVAGIVFVPTVSADVTDPYAIVVPASWELLGEESFIATEKTGLSQFSSSAFTAISTTGYNNAEQKITSDAVSYVDNRGLCLTMPAGTSIKNEDGTTYKVTQKNNSATFTLTNGLDLSASADYYIMYDMQVSTSDSSYTQIKLFDSTNYDVTAANEENKAPHIIIKASTSKSPIYVTSTFNNIYTNGTAQTSHTYGKSDDHNFDHSYLGNRWYKILTQISVRDGKPTLVRQRWFDINGTEGAEVPSAFPEYWSNVAYYNTGDILNKIDSLTLECKHDLGSGKTGLYKNLKVYKSAPINTYHTPTTDGAGKQLSSTTLYPTEALVSTNNVPYTLTMDTVPAGVELVSQGWYDYTDAANPVLLAEGASYTIPSSMQGKLLKAKIIANEGGIETTYFPFSGRVKHIVSLYASKFDKNYNNATPANNTLVNSNPFGVKLTYFKSNADGTVSTSKASANTIRDVSKLTYENWANATQLEILVRYKFNGYANANDGVLAFIVAQYDKDGALKKLVKPADISTMSYSSINSSRMANHYFKKANGDLNIEPGDYFKGYFWRTNSSVKVGNTYKYNYEEIIPVVYSEERTDITYDYNQPIITVPYPAE